MSFNFFNPTAFLETSFAMNLALNEVDPQISVDEKQGSVEDDNSSGNETSENVSDHVGQVDSVSLLAPSLSVEYADKPALNLDGTLRKKRGRKPGQKNGEKAVVTSEVKKTATQSQAQKLTAEQTAKLLLNTGVGMLVELIGIEWDFESVEEATTLKMSVAAYIESKGGTQLSPELILVLALGSYALPRARHRNTREKITYFLREVVGKVLRLFKR